MKHIISYISWEPIHENTKLAKQYAISAISKKLGKASQISPEQLEGDDILTPAVKEIFELTKNHPGYTLAFLRFYFEQNIPLTQPENEAELRSLDRLMSIIKDKKHIISQLEHNVDYYASQKSEEDTITGFEVMADEIRTLERVKDAKWFSDSLPRTLRDQYRALPKSEQTRVISLAIQLKELGKSAIDRLFEKIKAFTNWTIEDVIDYTSNYVKGFSNLELNKKIAEIEELEPDAGIIYSDNQYLVLSLRTEAAQKKLCAIANWCINRGAWNTYGKDGVQINIFNFGIDPSDPLFLTGTTIYYTGGLHASHDINDKNILKSKDPAKHLIALGYPEKLVSTVLQYFPTEVAIKKIISELRLDHSSPEEFLIAVIRNSYQIDMQNNLRIAETLLSLVKDKILDKVSRQQILNFYTKYGVMSRFAAQVLKELLGTLTKIELQSIRSATIKVFKLIHKANNLIEKPSTQIKIALAQEKDILIELE